MGVWMWACMGRSLPRGGSVQWRHEDKGTGYTPRVTSKLKGPMRGDCEQERVYEL